MLSVPAKKAPTVPGEETFTLQRDTDQRLQPLEQCISHLFPISTPVAVGNSKSLDGVDKETYEDTLIQATKSLKEWDFELYYFS